MNKIQLNLFRASFLNCTDSQAEGLAAALAASKGQPPPNDSDGVRIIWVYRLLIYFSQFNFWEDFLYDITVL